MNQFFKTIVREMNNVKEGKGPEDAAYDVLTEFAYGTVYISMRAINSSRVAARVVQLKDQGLETRVVAERMGLSKRHVRRLYQKALEKR